MCSFISFLDSHTILFKRTQTNLFSGQQIFYFPFLKSVSFAFAFFPFPLLFNSISKAKSPLPLSGLYQSQLAFCYQERMLGKEESVLTHASHLPINTLVPPHHLLSTLPGWAMADDRPLCVLCPRRTWQLSGRSGKASPAFFPSKKMGYNHTHAMEKQNVSGKPPFWTSGCIALISASTFRMPSRRLTALLSLS